MESGEAVTGVATSRLATAQLVGLVENEIRVTAFTVSMRTPPKVNCVGPVPPMIEDGEIEVMVVEERDGYGYGTAGENDVVVIPPVWMLMFWEMPNPLLEGATHRISESEIREMSAVPAVPNTHVPPAMAVVVKPDPVMVMVLPLNRCPTGGRETPVTVVKSAK